MDSSARDAKRARRTPSAGDAVDLISGLDDDVLLSILSLLPDVRDAARTATLSRRWLGLWTRVPALRFVSRPLPLTASAAERYAALERYVSLVDGVLARRRARSGCAVVETLSVSYTYLEKQRPTPAFDDDVLCRQDLTAALAVGAPTRRLMMQASVHGVQGWIRHAFQHGVKSLDLDMQLPRHLGHVDDSHGDSTNKLMVMVRLDDDDLPSPAGLETMRLALGGARLHLSTGAMKFASLKDLSLERIGIADARLLAHLVSSPSCPHLQKLRMSMLRFPSFSDEMRIEADMLSELWIQGIDSMSLELRTPSLRVLHVDRCHNEVLSISAPKLEEVAFFSRPEPGRPLGLLRIYGDLLCVQTLKLCMWSHRRHHTFHGGEEQNDSCVLLLKRCSLLKCLEVTLGGPKYELKPVEHVDLIKDKVPHLPHIKSLTVNVSKDFERHDFGVGVANLLTRFTNLTHLSLHLPFFYKLFCDLKSGLHLDCDHPNYWNSHEISMVHLQEVELTELTGVDCELWFMEAVLASAKRLCKVSISFQKQCRQHSDKMDAFEHMLLDEGMWASHRDEHMITCLNTRCFF